MKRAFKIACVTAMILAVSVGQASARTLFEDGENWFGSFMADYIDSPVEPVAQLGDYVVVGNHWSGESYSTRDGGEVETDEMFIDSITDLGNGYLRMLGTDETGDPFEHRPAVNSTAHPVFFAEVPRVITNEDILLAVGGVKAPNPSLLNMAGQWNHVLFQTVPTSDGQPLGEVQHAAVDITATSDTQGSGIRTAYGGGSPSPPFPLELDRSASKLTVSGANVPGYIAVITEDTIMRVNVGQDADPDELGVSFFFRQRPARSLDELVGRWNAQGLMTEGDLGNWNSQWATLEVFADGTFRMEHEGDALSLEPPGRISTGSVSMGADGWIVAQPDEPGAFPVVGMASLAGDTIVMGSTDPDNVILQIITPAHQPGDTDRDGDVDAADLGNLVAQFGIAPDVESADFNHDDVVDLEDFAIMRGNFGSGMVSAPEFRAIVPEPATLSLLALLALSLPKRGGLAMLRWRRK